MELKPIKNDVEYERMMEWIDEQFERKPALNTPEGDNLEVALLLVKAYEDVHFQIPIPDPIDAIKLKMEERGLKSKDLADWIGSKSYVSALLNRKKPLTLKLAKLFHERPPHNLLKAAMRLEIVVNKTIEIELAGIKIAATTGERFPVRAKLNPMMLYTTEMIKL